MPASTDSVENKGRMYALLTVWLISLTGKIKEGSLNNLYRFPDLYKNRGEIPVKDATIEIAVSTWRSYDLYGCNTA